MTDETQYPLKPQIEKLLEEWHVSYEFLADARLTDVDDRASTRNQIRLMEVPYDEDTIARYAQLLRSGSPPPPGIARAAKGFNPPFTVWDGNQRRRAAARARRATMALFVCHSDTDPDVMKRLGLHMNAVIASWAMTKQERTTHGILMIEQERSTLQQAAQAVGMTVPDLRNHLGQHRAKKRAMALEVPNLHKLTATSLGRLGAIVSDAVFAEACKLTLEAKLTAEEVSTLTTEVNKRVQSEAGQLTFIAEERERFRTRMQMVMLGGAPRYKFPWTNRLMLTSSNIAKLDVDKTATEYENSLNPDAQFALLTGAVAAMETLAKLVHRMGG